MLKLEWDGQLKPVAGNLVRPMTLGALDGFQPPIGYTAIYSFLSSPEYVILNGRSTTTYALPGQCIM
jgi:hypothetical protein